MMKSHFKFNVGFAIGLCLSLLVACAGNVSVSPTPPQTATTAAPVNTIEQSDRRLREQLLPQIAVQDALVPDYVADKVVVTALEDPLPQLDDYPLYGAQPSADAKTVYLEIFSSAEKANAERRDERWLIDVAEAFNQQQQTVKSGEVIQVGIRNIPSGLGAQLIAAAAAKPAGYTPSNELWLQILKQRGTPFMPVNAALVPNSAGFVVESQAYQALAAGGEVTFDRLLDAILAGQLTLGYPNPYSSSSALNLLYTIFWQAAGHNKDGKPLTAADLQSPQIASMFTAFQNQVLVTTQTTLDLKDIFLRDQQKLQAFPLDYQSYATLKQTPGFEQTGYVPFGVPHSSPLVSFKWNTPMQQEALAKFAAFATAAPMQQAAKTLGFETTPYLSAKKFPPVPTGTVLESAQSFWKQRKDGDRTVYMMLVIDTSGSMDGDRLDGVKKALRLASGSINAGNQVGLVTFGDAPVRRMKLAPFNQLEQQRLLVAIDDLKADGSTAMYDGLMVGVADLLEKQKADPNGRFSLMLLSDGEVTKGLQFAQVQDVLNGSGVRIYPIAYGEVNQQELQAIATLREGSVYDGNPETVQRLLKDLFQTNL